MTYKWQLTIVNISYLQNISLKCKYDATERSEQLTTEIVYRMRRPPYWENGAKLLLSQLDHCAYDFLDQNHLWKKATKDNMLEYHQTAGPPT